MSASKPVILLISGGWHVPTSYDKLTNLLKSSGHEVHVPELPSMNGARPPTADLETDTTAFREYALNLANAGKNVIVISHSYGGQVATNSLSDLAISNRSKQGLPGGVLHIVSLSSFTITEGRSMFDIVDQFGHASLMPVAFDFAEDGTCVDRDPKGLLVTPGPDESESEVEWYLGTLQRWNGKCMYQPITAERAAWKDIPVTCVLSTRDMTVPVDYQRWMVDVMKKEGAEVEAFELDSGHSVDFSKAKEVAEIVNNVVARYEDK
ncbi:alpha/beta-hydrolase [Aspergillus piperis CBS 112811]|uniref:Alpha/beta-hydrolase n=1 Tax=Aspergillus piperis CBS 112811 TaxID=1448313 RepID=A0A8G1VN17_9EURO|nr:alpha/beta-hydrolase [Aspergillus piperis CBS 112811]RAH59301.1 alpha/beta-hydrolase [Aspergillus piperis CBS 112811]